VGSGITLQVPRARPKVARLTLRMSGSRELHPRPGLNRGAQAPLTIFPDQAPIGSVSFQRSIWFSIDAGGRVGVLAGARWAWRRSSIAFATRNDAAPDSGIVIRSVSVLGVSLAGFEQLQNRLGTR
jgi:hypothetical protein